MPDKLVTREALDQAWVLFMEAAGVLHEGRVSWLTMAEELQKSFEAEEMIMGKSA